MGLDMYAYSTDQTLSRLDFEKPKDRKEIAYWRKHANLHGWMEQLYRSHGGAQRFNCVNVALTAEDIDALERTVLADELPFTEGFFFGESIPEDKEDDIAFIAKARECLAAGKSVYYTSWW
ncbi:MAG: phosphoglycerate kinase [Burkholderiales bacterium]|nr:phosphoglycerate kinase [Burkholderiales bacterium]